MRQGDPSGRSSAPDELRGTTFWASSKGSQAPKHPRHPIQPIYYYCTPYIHMVWRAENFVSVRWGQAANAARPFGKRYIGLAALVGLVGCAFCT